MKILMPTMSMDIGGAETHVLELSRALVRAGCQVTVVSCGGAFLPALAEAGVEHVTLPLNTKRPAALLKSYFGLRRLIRAGNYDIVHAHARIPAFLCGLLHRQMGFRFVTSAHAHFKVNAWLRTASDWGERTMVLPYTPMPDDPTSPPPATPGPAWKANTKNKKREVFL